MIVDAHVTGDGYETISKNFNMTRSTVHNIIIKILFEEVVESFFQNKMTKGVNNCAHVYITMYVISTAPT